MANGGKENKRALLINVPANTAFVDCPADASAESVGLGYIGAYLASKGICDVELLDAIALGWAESKILEHIELVTPDFICLSPTYMIWNSVIRILSQAKATNPNVITILGGPHVSFEPTLSRALSENACIDYIVSGEGEIAVHNIIKQFLENDTTPIPGVSGKVNGQVVVADTMAEYVANLDSLPFPLRNAAALQGKAIRITSSRGCYRHGAGCSFCSTPLIFHDGWRSRSAKNVVDEIELLSKQGFNKFISGEADFFGPSKEGLQRAEKIANEIIVRGLKISLRIMAGVHQILAAEKIGLWEKLKAAGVQRVYTGVESADADTLKDFDKHQDITGISRAINILHEKGFAVQIGFIMFHPWSTLESLQVNAKFLMQFDQAHLWSNFSNSLLLLPNSKLLERAAKENLLKKDITTVGFDDGFVFNYKFANPDIERIHKACMQIMENETVTEFNRNLIAVGIETSSQDVQSDPIRCLYEEVKEASAEVNLATFNAITSNIGSTLKVDTLESVIANHVGGSFPKWSKI